MVNDLTTLVSDSIKQFGQAFFVTTYLPATVFVGLHLYVLIPLWQQQFDLRWLSLSTPVDLAALAATLVSLLLSSLPLAVSLTLLNDTFIRIFEGKVIWLKWGLLAPLTKRNQQRAKQQTDKLSELTADLRVEYRDQSQHLLQATTQEEQEQAQRALISLGQQLDQAYSRLAQEHSLQQWPIDVRRIAPTRFGNIYALAEEYAYRRYGVDSILFWPRLRQLMAKHAPNHSTLISQQKSWLDLTIHSSVVASLLAVESLISLIFYQSGNLLLIWLALFGSSILLTAGFYQAALNAVTVLGELIKQSFDYHRHLVLTAFKLPQPQHLLIERDVWIKLARFIRWGDEAYLLEAQAIARHYQEPET